MGSYYDSEPSSPTPHIEKKDDIDARLAALDKKPMVHILRIMTLENAKRNDERMEGGESSVSLNTPIYATETSTICLMSGWTT